MCGIFGFVANNKDSRPSIKRLAEIAIATETRGRHAFGFAWIDSRNRLRMFKQTGRISDSLGMLSMMSDARMLIGHCRYATAGCYRNNLNNHPHPSDGGWIAHNGVISRAAELAEDHDLPLVTECDSEVLAQLIEDLDGTLVGRCEEASELAADSPLAMLGLWRNPNRLIALRRGNPLSIGQSKSGHYFASLTRGLPSPQTVRDDSLLSFTWHGDRSEVETVQMMPTNRVKRRAPSSLFA